MSVVAVVLLSIDLLFFATTEARTCCLVSDKRATNGRAKMGRQRRSCLACLLFDLCLLGVDKNERTRSKPLLLPLGILLACDEQTALPQFFPQRHPTPLFHGTSTPCQREFSQGRPFRTSIVLVVYYCNFSIVFECQRDSIPCWTQVI